MKIKIQRKEIIIIAIIAFFIALSFILRALPVFFMDFPTYHLHRDPDTWYNFRQIEVMVSNFPQYNWFDPMTAFPTGKEIAWGPMFTVSAAILPSIFGVTQRFEIMMMASWIPVIFSLLMIPVMFYLGRLIGDWKTGIIAAIFISVISGNYFYESYFGVVDHHIAEVFFTTIFSLFYIAAITSSNKTEISLWRPSSVKILLFPSVMAGIALGIGLLTSPTCLIFLLIVGVYTILQYSWYIFRHRTADFLFVINSIILLIPLIFLVLNGFPSPTYSLMNYSVAQIHLLLFFILGTLFLQIISLLFKEKPYFFIISILGAILALMGGIYVVSLSLLSDAYDTIATLFIPGTKWATINELTPWSLGEIWLSFNIGIILALGGLLFMIYHLIKKENPANLYTSVWAFSILLLTIMQLRWEYYCAVIISLLSAYALTNAFIQDLSKSYDQGRKNIKKSIKSGKVKNKKISFDETVKSGILGGRKGISLILVCMVLFCGISVLYDYAIVRNTREKFLIPSQWVGVLEWVQTTTPDPDISYYGPYVSEGWQYPQDTYGILSWWDSGHWITYIAKRTPVTNPFQDNIEISAAFFLTESENIANEISDSYGIRYIITDSEMTFAKFPGMIQWYNKTLQTGYYTDTYYLPDPETPGHPELIGLINQPYYSTMIVRLHNFDGSLAVPDQVAYAITAESQNDTTAPIITTIEFLDHASGMEKLNAFESRPEQGTSAVLKGFLLNSPVEKTNALRHYRLIYEDAGLLPDGGYDFSSTVKVFEYVPGARVTGEGIIEVEIRTNLGRTFVYRQEAENGFFILPYSTVEGRYPVTTTGPYHIVSTGNLVEITEDDVMSAKSFAASNR